MSWKLVCDNCGAEWWWDPDLYRTAYPSMWEASVNHHRVEPPPSLGHTRHFCDACCRARDEGAAAGLLARRPKEESEVVA